MHGVNSHAAEIKLLSASALEPVMPGLLAQFEKPSSQTERTQSMKPLKYARAAVALLLSLAAPVAVSALEDVLRAEDGLSALQEGDFATAVPLLRERAEQGNTVAQTLLSQMYITGWGVPQHYAEAAKWYWLAANRGNAKAQFNLGVMYAKGQGVPQDYAEAAKWYRLAANQGHAFGQTNLGHMYYTGQGGPVDYAEALKWYRLAADQGDAGAQFNLGVMYAKGQGVPQDYAEAAKWYRLTADQGYAGAQNNLGYMYANGQGVPQDFVSAHMWLDLCAAQGSQAAAKDRDAIAQRMTPAQIAEARKLARDWKPTAQPISTSNSPTF